MVVRIMSELRANVADAIDLFWMLWHHGTFPLRWVVYASAAFLVGGLVGTCLS
jgi:hypothetical protein